MYEDASWYSNLIPRQHTEPPKSKHRRRESLLKQPNESTQADVEPAPGIQEIADESSASIAPPQATVARRAKSYSDFYDVVTSHLKKERERELKKQSRESKNQIGNELEFFDWYNAIGNELLDDSHEEYTLYRDQLDLSKSHIDNLLIDTSAALRRLTTLTESFQTVESQTTAFRTQCEGLVNDQKRVVQLADDIGKNVEYYSYLEPMTRRLNAPGAGNHVRRKEFSDMLATLDTCLEYMESHVCALILDLLSDADDIQPNQRESATYRSRYRLLLTRGLQLIRVHVTNALREIAADVAKRIADRQLNDTTMSALLYAKFRVGAPELKQLGLEIQRRAVLPKDSAPGAEAEYQSLMNELFQSYSTTRGRLILPIISKKMTEIALAPSTSKDVVSFARSSIGFVRGVCFDEYDLWREWFDTEDGLYEFLESICEPLFDHLRPRTIRETQMTKLCELCTLIQSRYMELNEDDDEPLQTNRLNFPALVQPALEDAQTRLVFLALSVLRSDIELYKPKPEDLDYPARNRRSSQSLGATGPVLSGRKSSQTGPPMTPLLPKIPTVVELIDEEGLHSLTAMASQDWYPTLRRAIWLLSKIYRLVNSTVFDDLAHQIVHQTTISLHAAADMITKRASPTDSKLFLIQYLLILKQQIVAFDIEFVTPEVAFDFSTMTSTFYELRSRGGLFDPRNLMRLVGGGLVPKVVENMLDAKVELDGKLRTVINDFTSSFATRIASPISESLSTKKPFDAHTAANAVRQNAEKEVPFLRKKLEEYIEDIRTRETLVAAVQDSVMELYEEFFDRYTAQIQASGKTPPKRGKGREDDVWDPEMFGDWAEGLFNVGRLIMHGAGEEDDMDSMGSGLSRSGST